MITLSVHKNRLHHAETHAKIDDLQVAPHLAARTLATPSYWQANSCQPIHSQCELAVGVPLVGHNFVNFQHILVK